jgi:hypothetical protein
VSAICRVASVLLAFCVGWTAPGLQLPRVTAAVGISQGQYLVSFGGRRTTVHVIRAALSTYQAAIGLARGKVGATEDLASIAQRRRAVAAINGCFFDAYTSGPIKLPYHHLILNGRLVHIGNHGTTLGFTRSGTYRMGPVRVLIRGGTAGRWGYPNNWYAYFVNHPATSSGAVLYTGDWVSSRTPAQGTQVVVRRGVVTALGTGSHRIPDDGFVLAFVGRERFLASRFRIGERVDYRTQIQAEDGEFWQDAVEALSCGPTLLRRSQVVVAPVAEGFSSPKILVNRASRSAVGLTGDNSILLVSASAVTIRDLAEIMQRLGAVDAMNLDGGASSGLWVRGTYLTRPGRLISHAIIILPR